MLNKFLSIFFILITILCVDVKLVFAQQDQLNRSQQFRLAERIIRIAEPGELADSLNLWGDVNSAGRYLVPKGTKLIDLLSYSGGMITIRDGQTNLDWSKMRVEIYVHELNKETNKYELVEEFTYRFEESFPEDMWAFKLKNNNTISVRVKRRPSFRDYLGVFASTVTAIASTVILIERLNGN